MSKTSRIEIEAGGVLRLPPGLMRVMRAPLGTVFSPLAAGQNALILFREDEQQMLRVNPQDCALLGRIGAFGVADLFSTINMSQKSGMLMFESGPVVKRVFFESGEIVFAESSDPQHRLGEFLVRRGKLSREQVDALLRQKTPGVRLGARLVQEGYLSARDLYDSVRAQIEEIIYSIFPMNEGWFWFFEGDFLDEDLSQFRLNTQNILMEGYRRLDEWSLMRERVPHQDVILVVREGAAPERFDSPQAEKLFGLIDGRRSLKVLMQKSGLGEFDVTRVVYDLMRKGIIDTVDPKAMQSERGKTVEGLIEAYDRLFQVIAQALVRAGQGALVEPQAFQDLIVGLDERARTLLDGVTFDAEHGLGRSIPKIVANLERLQKGQKSVLGQIAGLGDMFKRKQVQSTLDELLNYLLFTLKNALPPDQADAFITRIRTAHRKLRDVR